MFAVITPALISGAYAERIRFKAMLLFTTLWVFVVYFPMAHMVWGKGGLLNAYSGGSIPTFDFAGGTVVHINAGIAGLVAAIVLGKRRGWPREAMPPHNLTLTVLGAGLLWFGWFGFNAGSALGASELAASAFVATHIAAAAATFSWVITEWLKVGKPTTLGAASGAVAGLVAITPCAGFVRPWAAGVIGLGSGSVCFLAVSLKRRFGYDDSLDVVGVHLVGGMFGSLAVGLFAQEAVNAAGADGLFFGKAALIAKQAAAVGATLVWSGVLTFVILKIVDAAVGLRVSEDDETTGLDLSLHEETGYNLTPVGTLLGSGEETP